MLLITIIYRILQKDIWKIHHFFPVPLTFVLGAKGKIQWQLQQLKWKNNWASVELSPFAANGLRYSYKQLWILLWDVLWGKTKKDYKKAGEKTCPV